MPVTTVSLDRGGVDVVVTGRLTPRLGERMLDAVRKALVDVPRAVVVDLSAVSGLSAAGVGALFVLADLARDWPESPIVLVATDPLNAQLASVRVADRLVVRPTLLAAQAVSGTAPRVVVDRTELASSSAAPAIARRFVRDHLPRDASQHLRDSAALVVTELVTHAVLNGGDRLHVRMVVRGRVVRIAVGDPAPSDVGDGLSPAAPADLDGDDRGLMVVRALSVRFGVLPTSGGGSIVWSLLDDEPPPITAGAD
jgi:anti-anti-sigma regulatory factor